MLCNSLILRLAKRKKNLLVSKQFNEKPVIIDFYNLYCNITEFNKYKTFSRETYIICLDLILKKFKNNRIFIVSKNIFEIEREYIKKTTRLYKNLTYIIPEDIYYKKSLNRERDDYVCLVLNDILENALVISNDKLRNLGKIITDVKPIKILTYRDGYEKIDIISQDFITSNIKKLNKNGLPELVEFKFE